jgi:Flp pilus assembly protein CpaB
MPHLGWRSVAPHVILRLQKLIYILVALQCFAVAATLAFIIWNAQASAEHLHQAVQATLQNRRNSAKDVNRLLIKII